jgi:uncharacterized repeat protein (TIGR01451 family)
MLLTSTLLLTPALVIAQDAEASAQPVAAAQPSGAAEESAPAAEPAPAQEPAPEPKAEEPKAEEPEAAPAHEPEPEPKAEEPKQEPRAEDPKDEKEQKPDKPDQEQAAGPAPEAAPAEAAPAEPERRLVVDSEPRKLDLLVGDMAKLSAWLCPLGDAPFGPDTAPATADDACTPAQDAAWSVDPIGVATLGKDEAAKVRLSADAPIADAKVIAELGDRKDSVSLSIAAAPAPAPLAEPPVMEGPKPDKETQGPTADVADPAAQADLGNGVNDSKPGPGSAEDSKAGAADRPASEMKADAPVAAGTFDGAGSLIEPQLEIQPAANNFTVTPASQTVTAGSTSNFSWTFTAQNSGNVTTTTFTIPVGWTAPRSTAGPGQIIVNAGTCGATLAGVSGRVATIDQGPGSATCTIGQTFSLQYLQATAPTPASPPQTYTFTSQHGSSPTVTVTAPPSADLSVTKSDSPDPVTAGANLTYTLTVSNAGPSDAQTVSLADTLPTGTTFVSLGQGSGPAFSCTTPAVGASGAISCTRTSLVTAAPQTFTLVVKVGASVATGTVISNTATVSSSTTDPNSANNTATDTNTVDTAADLGIDKKVEGQDGNPVPVAVTAGQTITYTLIVTNAGPSDASGVVISDPLPAVFTQVTLGAVTPSSLGCNLAPPGAQFVLTCNAATMAAGSTATVTLTAVVPGDLPDGTIIANTASVTAGTPQVPDTLPNTDTASVKVGAVADLSVTKGVSPAETVSGGTVTYTLAVSNAGPSGADNATLSDTFPAQLQGATVVDDGPYTCAPVVGNTLTCTIASHPVGVVATITVTATVVPGTYLDLMTVSNTATVSSQITDPNPTDNTATATFKIRSTPAISVTKTATPSTVPEPGGEVSFAIKVTNTGNVPVSLTSLVDNVHGDVNGKGTCALPQSLAPGASYACSFAAFVGGNAGTIETDVVTARASTSDGRQVSASDDATVTITNALPGIAVTKTASVSELVEPGGDVTYTIAIQNLVREPLTIVALTDDKFGDLDDPQNRLVTDNTCARAIGDLLPAGGTLECRFTARVTGQAGERHVNTVTVTAKDDDEAPAPAGQAAGVVPAAVTVVSATARAVVRIVSDPDSGGGEGTGGGGGDKQPSTDTLLPTDDASAASGLVDGAMGWALIILAAAMLIVSGAWLVRRQRLTRT